MLVRPANTAEEEAQALGLADRAYRERSYVTQLEALAAAGTTALVALTEQTMVGSVSVALRNGIRLPTEVFFRLDLTEVFSGIPSDSFMEIGRLAVDTVRGPTRSLALCGLIAGAQLWGDSHQVPLAVVSLRPALTTVLRGMGIECQLLADPSALDREAVPEAYHGYFFPPQVSQAPSAFLIDLNQSRAAVNNLPPFATGQVEVRLEAQAPAGAA